MSIKYPLEGRTVIARVYDDEGHVVATQDTTFSIEKMGTVENAALIIGRTATGANVTVSSRDYTEESDAIIYKLRRVK